MAAVEVVEREESVRRNIPIGKVHLNSENPRLTDDGEGKSEKEY